MALTTYITDTHADASYVDAVSTVVNHLSKKYAVNSSLVHTGDFVDARSSEDDIKAMNDSLGKFNGHVYGILGNHDLVHDGIEEKLDNVELIEFQQKKINGLTHYAIRHHSGNGGDYVQENEYKSLEDKFSQVEEHLPTSDVLLAHEGMDVFSYQEKTYHKATSALVKKYDVEVISGHIHSTKTGLIGEDSLAFGYRGCASTNNDFFIRVGYGKQSQMYQLSNEAIRSWAKQINPDGVYDAKVTPKQQAPTGNPREQNTQLSKEEAMDRFERLMPRLSPEFLEKLNSGNATPQEIAQLNQLIMDFDEPVELAA